MRRGHRKQPVSGVPKGRCGVSGPVTFSEVQTVPVQVCMHVYAICARVCAGMREETRGRRRCLSSIYLHLVYLKRGLSLSLELPSSARLPGILWSLPPPCWDYRYMPSLIASPVLELQGLQSLIAAFYIGAKDSNSDPGSMHFPN